MARTGELYALTWNNIDLNSRLIKVDYSWNNVDGFKSTKSGDDRMVEIAPPLLPILKELKLKNPDSHFVLPRLRKWEKGEQARELRLFLMGNGIKKDLKTMTIYCRKAGVDIKGITDHLDLHNPSQKEASVIEICRKPN